MSATYRVYLLTVAATTIATLACAALVGATVDPYGITNLFVLERFNKKKPHQIEQARIAKPVHAVAGTFDILVLGISQVEQGFNPADPLLKELRIYNLGLSELRLHEAAALVDFLSRNANSKTVLISLDFLRYNSPVAGHPFLPAPADMGWIWIAQRLVQAFLAFQSLQDSWKTVQWNLRSKGNVWQQDDLGWLNINSGPALPTRDVRFDNVYRATFDETDYLGLTASRAGQFRKNGFDHADLARIVKLAAARQLNVIVFIAPRDARQYEALHLVGLLPLFDQWCAEVACIVAPKLPLWDFSGYNDITTEDSRWSDTVHFDSDVGTAILDRVLALDLPEFRGKKFGRIVDVASPGDWGPESQYSNKAARYNRRIADIHKEKGKPKPVSLNPDSSLRCDGPDSIQAKHKVP